MINNFEGVLFQAPTKRAKKLKLILLYKETIMNQLTTFNPEALNRALIGFDSIFDGFERRFANQIQNNYPPYNIIKQSEDEYFIELAVTGFEKNEITIEVEREHLTIKGAKQAENENETTAYLHRGLAQRDFTRVFTLADHIEVSGAEIKNGILNVKLVRNVPEYAKPKLIDIVEVK